MGEDENLLLKNKISELKERLSMIYSQSALDANKSKAFESEFSLYVKACAVARKERSEGIRLQHDAIKFGLAVLTVAIVFTAYAFNMHLLLAALVLLGVGFVACGFMYVLLAQEIRIMRAGEFCVELESYFKRHRWSTELNEVLHLSAMPAWEEYRSKWDKDIFLKGPYRKTAIYAPFRIGLALADLSALFFVIRSFIAPEPERLWIIIISLIVWCVAVSVQMLLVNTIVNNVDKRISGEIQRLERRKKKQISWDPGTWGNILKLLFVLDIIFPEEMNKSDS